MNVKQVKHLAGVLERCGKKTVEQRFPDGTVLLILPYGGRIIGFGSAGSEQNVFWTHPALISHASAEQFFAQHQWHNSGGDRTWLAPEIDIFFPQYPDMKVYTQPAQLDPGNYSITQTETSLSLSNTCAVKLSRSRQVVHTVITKTMTAAQNPAPLQGVDYAGYTTSTTLEIFDPDKDNSGPVGLWHLMQFPCGGQMLMPTYHKASPLVVFGEIPDGDLSVSDNLCRYNVSHEGSCKFSLAATEITGRAGYVFDDQGQQTLVVRNFFVNPSGLYIDVPFNDTQRTGFAFQVCKINNEQWGSFCEMEYHAPAIGAGTGESQYTDLCQTWAFRGSPAQIQTIINMLLTPSVIL
ncbi:MAG: DUF6786 family protein [Anaerohalosphaeraceae bacterium]